LERVRSHRANNLVISDITDSLRSALQVSISNQSYCFESIRANRANIAM